MLNVIFVTFIVASLFQRLRCFCSSLEQSNSEIKYQICISIILICIIVPPVLKNQNLPLSLYFQLTIIDMFTYSMWITFAPIGAVRWSRALRPFLIVNFPEGRQVRKKKHVKLLKCWCSSLVHLRSSKTSDQRHSTHNHPIFVFVSNLEFSKMAGYDFR